MNDGTDVAPYRVQAPTPDDRGLGCTLARARPAGHRQATGSSLGSTP